LGLNRDRSRNDFLNKRQDFEMISEAARRTRQTFTADWHRPRYHFLPPSNWMNDPNGVIQWQGQYHLFYQHNPGGPLWGDMHWGHAVSPDLIHWQDLPLAIAPTPGSPDEAGIFSGCIVNHDGTPTVFYTGTRGERNNIQTQCLATSADNLLTWQKHPGNPIIGEVPPEAGQTADFRDPFVWKEADGWYMVLGSRIQDVGGVVFLYRSQNLIDWEYLNPLLVSDAAPNTGIWECPNFFKLDDRWVLIISGHTGSSTGDVAYFVGDYANHRFTPTSRGILDFGQLYAPLSMLDDQNRRILFGWVREARSEVEQRQAGWSGVQSIPRVLALDDQERLHMTPVPELEKIRMQHHHYNAMDLTERVRLDVTGLAFDISAEFEVQAGGQCSISLACAPDNQEHIDIAYDAATQHLIVRKVGASGAGALVTHIREARHELAAGEMLQLRILLDGSVVEIIANERTSITSRVYSSHAENNGVAVSGTNARLHALDLWEMPSIWQ
jgi:beta-fructofuranosidase